MPDNKTTPKDTISQLQAYKKNNLNELLSKIAAQKSAAMSLRVSISNVVDKLNALAQEEAEKAALQEQLAKEKAEES
ncbi:MAG: hypothetical protein MJ193_04965, partial [Clostridia bacterium]|nr:hypothetical protein [Clostridia bacterium]